MERCLPKTGRRIFYIVQQGMLLLAHARFLWKEVLNLPCIRDVRRPASAKAKNTTHLPPF